MKKDGIDREQWIELFERAARSRERRMAERANRFAKSALAAVQEVSDADRKEVALMLCEGFVAFLRKRYQRAELMFHSVLQKTANNSQLDPTIARMALVQLGEVKAVRNKLANAASCFEQAIQITPDDQLNQHGTAAILHKLAVVYTAMRRDASAMSYLRATKSANTELTLSARMFSQQALGKPVA